VLLRERDCHSHVIPGVDDGSRSLEESLEMLRLLHAAGARTVVATSHVFPGRFPNEYDDLAPRLDELRAAAARAEIPVELLLGGEHWLDETLRPRIRAGRALAFGAERYVLFECHTGAEVPVGLFETVRELTEHGHTPLLAHPERYHWLRGEDGDEVLHDLRAAGVRFQVNRTVGEVNAPGVGPRGRTIALLQERDWIDEVGSDLHRPTAEGRPYAMDPRAAPGP
jgi:tyrosine-protein phosphatase YwqE